MQKEKCVIRQMFFGHRGSFDNIKMTEEYKSLLSKAVGLDNKLMGKLKEVSPEFFELYEKTKDAFNDANDEFGYTLYVEGYKFGSLVAKEVFSEGE